MHSLLPDRRSWRRSWPRLAACALGALVPACGSGTSDRPRNAILISIDTLRPDHLGCYGHERETSPTLDRIAAGGVRFTDVTAAAPWTLPSHATMLTGLYPAHHAVKSHETRLADGHVTLAEEFRGQGFETYAVVNTWNVGAPQFQLAQGFDQFRYIVETEEDANFQLKTFNNGEQVLATARELLGARSSGKPFFLFLHFYDVHTDFTPEEKYKDEFVGPYGGRLTGRTQQLIAFRNRGQSFTEQDLRWLREMYDAEIRQLDDLLAGFLDWLDEQGLADESLFVITSDHGEEFGEHGGVLHGRTQYQELLEIPLIVQGPGVPRGTVIDTPVHGVDVAPTILALMGMRPSVPVDGHDLSVLWRGAGTLPERALFGEADHNNLIEGRPVVDIKRMVRRGTDKLCLDKHTQEMELYDLGADPGEQQDLVGAAPEKVSSLRAELDRFMEGEVEPDVIPEPTAEERQQERRILAATGYDGDAETVPTRKPRATAEAAAVRPADSPAPAGTPADDPARAVERMNAAIDGLMEKPEHRSSEVTVQYLLVGVQGGELPDVTRTQVEAETRAAGLLDRVRAGEDFDALVKGFTDGVHPGIFVMSAGAGDESAGIHPRSAMEPAFGDVAWRLEVGEVGVSRYDGGKQQARSPFGYLLVKRLK